jgi:hypothetical protein
VKLATPSTARVDRASETAAAKTANPQKKVLNWRLLLGVAACLVFWAAVILGVIKFLG